MVSGYLTATVSEMNCQKHVQDKIQVAVAGVSLRTSLGDDL
jgi:hypothetical protein